MDILSGFFFWLAVLIFVGAVIWEIERDSGLGTTAVFIGGVGILWYLTGATNPWPWFSAHWAECVAYAAIYLAIGALWGVCKWWFFLHNKADEYENIRDSMQATWNGFTDETKKQYVDYKAWAALKGYPPAISQHKADYLMWFTWWPFSALWTLTKEPIKRISRYAYTKLASMMGRMSAAVFAGRFTELK